MEDKKNDVGIASEMNTNRLYRPDKTREEIIAEAKAINQAVREAREQEND